MTSNADQAWADMKNPGGEKYSSRVNWILNGSKRAVSQRPVSMKQSAVAPESAAVGEEGRHKSSTGTHSM